jgi:hypothetical protein
MKTTAMRDSSRTSHRASPLVIFTTRRDMEEEKAGWRFTGLIPKRRDNDAPYEIDPMDRYAAQLLKEFDGRKAKSVTTEGLMIGEFVAAYPLLHSWRQ